MKFFKFLIVYILVQSIFFTSVANAAGLGGWSVSSPIAQGASVIINGTKTVVINGANVLKTSTAKITPSVAQVSKVLARGAAGYALSIAVEQLLGAVDWVLDPENNQIKYKYIPFGAGCQSAFNKVNKGSYGGQAVLKSCSLSGTNNSRANFCLFYPGNGSTSCFTGVADDVQAEEKKLPLDVVAQKVIDNAESGSSDAQEATKAAAIDALANDPATQDNVRNQLDTNAKTQTNENAEAETKPKDPTAPDAGSDIAIKFPVFCSWAPSVCEAAQTVISFPQTLTNWWDRSTKSITESWTWTKEQYNAVTKSVTDFFKEEPNNDTELDIPEPEMPEIDTDLKFGGQCPDDRVAQIPFVLRTIEMKFSYQPVCQVVSDAKPVLIFVGFFIAALIVGGIKQ
ncbi:hypothetical protein BJD20_20035 [Acinetobacter proteolyticus]|uniref:virulence factor TspB C-terminal domain-related protein n=1 Tax=Acinetobacter proteolyticus TaxID=1776741 RepID=UPI00086340BE|nr:virulence factor TspB C-terminal domain-related protein [Acinetobacter proteolyticus]OEY93804.1 hypothetical protein BJD20_20035 [Acinetobacter proteolyticus]